MELTAKDVILINAISVGVNGICALLNIMAGNLPTALLHTSFVILNTIILLNTES